MKAPSSASLFVSTSSQQNWKKSKKHAPNDPSTPTYTTPRLAPLPPSSNQNPPSPFRAISSVFRKQQSTSKPPSIHSTLSTSTNTSSDTHASHPYGQMHAPPIPVVSSHDPADDEAECPVCLEPLSFSFRLPGEKPHIVPECGHALHEACFTAVYGPAPNKSRNVVRKANLGVCGVCRRPMKVGDGDGGKSNKLAALTGMGDHKSAPLYPGRDAQITRRRVVPEVPFNPNEDDPIEHHASRNHDSQQQHPHHLNHNHQQQQQQQYVVAPSIQVRPEFSSITRTSDPSQPLTCIVIIELPGKRPPGAIPGPVMPDLYSSRNGMAQHHQFNQQHQQLGHDMTSTSGHSHSPFSEQQLDHYGQQQHFQQPRRQQSHEKGYSMNSFSEESQKEPSLYSNATDELNPFKAITEDLRNRIIDWKGHPLSDLGPLQMYDLLSVRRDSAIREFYVYLFKEAIICVVEEKKRGLGRLLSNASGFTDPGSHSSGGSSTTGQSKGVLRLKGRIYVRHIKHVTASSAAGEMSLTIDMEDEMASFILIFKDRASLEAWRNTIQILVNQFQNQPPPSAGTNSAHQSMQPEEYNINEFGGSSKAARILSGGSGNTGTTGSSVDSLLHGPSIRSTMSSSTSQGQSAMRYNNSNNNNNNNNGSNKQQGYGQYGNSQQIYSSGKLTTLGEDDEYSMPDGYGPMPPGPPLVTPYTSSGPSNSLQPIPHPPMDLMIIVSIPPVNAPRSTAQLKIRVIKQTLDFIMASLTPRDRLSLVTFEVGSPGRVRRTQYMSIGKAESKAHLEKFVSETGGAFSINGIVVPDESDDFLVKPTVKDEKTDVVTAVNYALDVVLQRKGKSPIAGMVLVSDAADSTRRAQMDLVLARAEAANVPIHSLGYGRSHDPASLWLMSNHTAGTYTFVKDWYDLRSCVAGCIGGMMSIGLSSMKLHMRIVDSGRFRIRKVSGGPTFVISSDGFHVDVDVGELRYGEKKEMLVELELENARQGSGNGNGNGTAAGRQAIQPNAYQQGQRPHGSASSAAGGGRAMNATDQWVQSMGLDALTIGGDDTPDLVDGMMDRMIDEVPVIEVDASFFDPGAAKHVSRLTHPVLLTITLLPMAMGMMNGYGSYGGGGYSGMPNHLTNSNMGGRSSGPSPTPSQGASNAAASDPVIVRRRMELLASDMITRALVLVSKRNIVQAQNILSETRRILVTVLQNISRGITPGANSAAAHQLGGLSSRASRKEQLTLGAVRTMQAIIQDLQILSEALEDDSLPGGGGGGMNPMVNVNQIAQLFAHDQRNFGAQQAMILRDQKSWTGRSATERAFWSADGSIELGLRSMDWVGKDY